MLEVFFHLLSQHNSISLFCFQSSCFLLKSRSWRHWVSDVSFRRRYLKSLLYVMSDRAVHWDRVLLCRPRGLACAIHPSLCGGSGTLLSAHGSHWWVCTLTPSHTVTCSQLFQACVPCYRKNGLSPCTGATFFMDVSCSSPPVQTWLTHSASKLEFH